MESFLIKALQLILSLSILVIIHEFGHFIFARIFKVRVEKFYLFFNPWFSLFKYKPKNSETEYGIGCLPLGGYVQCSGMIDELMDKEQLAQPPQPWEFRSKPAGQRLLIMVGGVLMNFLLAFFIYAMIIFNWGDNYIPMDKTPLYFSELGHKVGFQDGDIILSANGKKLERYDDVELISIIKAKNVAVLRDGEERTIVLPDTFKYEFLETQMPLMDLALAKVDKLLPGSNAEKAGLQVGDEIVSITASDSLLSNPDLKIADSKKGDTTALLQNKTTLLFALFQSKLSKFKNAEAVLEVKRNGEIVRIPVDVNDKGTVGFAVKKDPSIVNDKYNFFRSFSAGASYGLRKLSFYVSQMEFIFTKKGIQNVGGFGAIGNLFPAEWDWLSFWSMTAFLSIILGFMNILPIPALDGGHVMFLLYEVITRRKPGEKFMEYAQMVGMVLLLILVLYANANDVFRFFFKS